MKNHIKVYEDFLNEGKESTESKVTITKLNPTTFRLEVDSKFGQTALTAGSEKEAAEMKSKIEKAFKDGKIHNIGGIGTAVYEAAKLEGDVEDSSVQESTFSVEDGIKIQSEQLARWKKLLQPKVYKDLEKWATEHNDKAQSGNQIIRGTDLDNFIGNYFNSYTPSNKRFNEGVNEGAEPKPQLHNHFIVLKGDDVEGNLSMTNTHHTN